MFAWFLDNWGTILLTLILIAAVTAIVLNLRKEKKQGRSSCGGSCGSCPMSGACHEKAQLSPK